VTIGIFFQWDVTREAPEPIIDEEEKVEAIQAIQEAIRDIQVVKFITNTATILPEQAKTLDNLVALLQKYPFAGLELTGHTDNVGTVQLNMALSLRRASEVKAYLAESGIASERMVLRGRGATDPMEENLTEEGMAKNRRVTIRVMVGR